MALPALPPTPKTARTWKELEQAVSIWTRQAQQAISKLNSSPTGTSQVADATHTGLLSSGDWSRFDAKQPAGAYIVDAPSDGSNYGRQDGAWVLTGGGLSDAPSDGVTYGRKDAAWVNTADSGYTTPNFDDNGVWSWVNQASSVIYASKNIRGSKRITFSKPSAATDNNMSLRVKPIPSRPFTLTLGIQLATLNYGNYTRCGLAVRDSTSGRLVILVLIFESPSEWNIDSIKFSDPANYHSGYSSVPVTASKTAPPEDILLAINDNGTNFTFYYSIDNGTTWVTLNSVSRTDFLVAPDTIGLVVDSSNSIDVKYNLFHYSESLTIPAGGVNI